MSKVVSRPPWVILSLAVDDRPIRRPNWPAGEGTPELVHVLQVGEGVYLREQEPEPAAPRSALCGPREVGVTDLFSGLGWFVALLLLVVSCGKW